MTKDTVHETERMVVTRVFDAPRALVWKAWTDPKYLAQWWGPKGFTAPVCKLDFRVGGRFLLCMRAPDGQEVWTGGEYFEIVVHEKIVYSMYFADAEGNKVEAAQYGIEHEAMDDAHDGERKNSGQLEGWNQILDKIAAVVAGLAQGK